MTTYENCPVFLPSENYTTTIGDIFRYDINRDLTYLRELAAEAGMINLDRIHSDDDEIATAEDDAFYDRLPELLFTNPAALRDMTGDPHAVIPAGAYQPIDSEREYESRADAIENGIRPLMVGYPTDSYDMDKLADMVLWPRGADEDEPCTIDADFWGAVSFAHYR